MADAMLLATALLCTTCGMAWFAFAKQPHWQQARGRQALPPRTARSLQLLGALALASSLLLCLRADHASMAALVWVMMLAGSSLLVAFGLAYRPHWLTWLVAFVR
jgi:hypothetical protein